MKIKSKEEGKVEMMMTPMIDIVFQLLTFFIMTFKIAAQEGDFNIKMPLAASGGMPEESSVPMKIRLTANPGGQLAGIQMNDRSFAGFPQLHQFIIGVIGSDRGPGSVQATAEVELDCDYDLRYEEVVNAVTSVSGYVGSDGQVVKLIEKLKFSPPRPPGG
jgi:biopolymer transport protein ExbD